MSPNFNVQLVGRKPEPVCTTTGTQVSLFKMQQYMTVRNVAVSCSESWVSSHTACQQVAIMIGTNTHTAGAMTAWPS
eukprot:CAMPEP_0202902248 /NCGR_PEP_ID=MMETSP1392-20130828/16747_1 /ASSEMBLY_ACC=CAM_ASM_000868 /TAXON_ID=225041 /ORGANISM="Chlamydomonas chlamydogama, Strain SAG 11-48b" /LENGTH=76 /DNA_ID=CAMNT_0049588987 /DNA_START=19 /DNA_END=249 /DNA_ORIENTATION=-